VEADLVVSQQPTSVGEVAVPVVVVDLERETPPEGVGGKYDHERHERSIDRASRPTDGSSVTTARRLGGRWLRTNPSSPGADVPPRLIGCNARAVGHGPLRRRRSIAAAKGRSR